MTQESDMSVSEESETGLQKSDRGSRELQKLQSQLDELKDMADLLPVLASVQEHLEQETAKHRSRMQLMMAMFALMFAFFLVAPIYLGKALLNQSRENFQAQQELQAELLSAIQSGGGSDTARQQAYAEYQAELEAEKARMRSVLVSLIDEVDRAITAQSEPAP